MMASTLKVLLLLSAGLLTVKAGFDEDCPFGEHACAITKSALIIILVVLGVVFDIVLFAICCCCPCCCIYKMCRRPRRTQVVTVVTR